MAPKTFTVSFDTAGGSKVASQKVREGARVSEPADPPRSGHSFDGWYKGDAKYDFSTPVTADLTLTARWRAKAAPVVRAAAMHRLYNPYTGEHFYTADTAERDHLTGLGWRYEGVGWKAPAKSSTPVYRLYNGHVRGGDHHYTTSASERDHLVSVGWTYEGVGWYSDDARGVPLYRQYNPYARTARTTTRPASRRTTICSPSAGVARASAGTASGTEVPLGTGNAPGAIQWLRAFPFPVYGVSPCRPNACPCGAGSSSRR